MVRITRYDFYEALSLTDWKKALDIRKDVIQAKGFKESDEVDGFLNKLYWAWKTPDLRGVMYVYLEQLVQEGLAEEKGRPFTDEENEQSIRAYGFIPNDITSRTVFRKSPTGIFVPKPGYVGNDLELSLVGF